MMREQFLPGVAYMLLPPLLAASCATVGENGASDKDALDSIGDCDLAVALVIDTSGSMNFVPEGFDESVLDVLKSACIEVVENVPSGAWNVGLVTFPGSAPPKWGMEFLTDDNREELVAAVDALVATGASPVSEGLSTGALALLSDVSRPRFLIVFSDGGWSLTPEGEAQLDWIAEQVDAFIIAVGYNLNSVDSEAMLKLASSDESGPAFVNATSQEDLHQYLIDQFGNLCSRLNLAVRVDGPEVVGTRGGYSGSVEVQYKKGSAQTLQLGSFGSWMADGSISFKNAEISVGPDQPLYVDKFGGTAPATAGQYEIEVSLIDPTSPSPVASGRTNVSVVDVDLTLDLTGNPPVVWNETLGRLEGEWHLHGSFGQGIPDGELGGFTYSVWRNGQPDPGWSGGPKAAHDIKSGPIDWKEPFVLTRSGNVPSGQYEVRISWTGLHVKVDGVATAVVP